MIRGISKCTSKTLKNLENKSAFDFSFFKSFTTLTSVNDIISIKFSILILVEEIVMVKSDGNITRP